MCFLSKIIRYFDAMARTGTSVRNKILGRNGIGPIIKVRISAVMNCGSIFGFIFKRKPIIWLEIYEINEK
jgi:hypothetical protein